MSKAKEEAKASVLRWRQCIIFSLLFIWLLIGMVMFKHVEHPAEVVDIENKQQNRDNFNQIMSLASKLSNYLKLHANLDHRNAIVKHFEPVLLEVQNDSIKLEFPIDFFMKNNFTWIDAVMEHCPVHSSVSKWDLSGSFFFVLTVVSTIGYGNYAPNTQTGRALCILYAVIGIPLMALCVKNIRFWLVDFVSWLENSIEALVKPTVSKKTKKIARKIKLRSVSNMLIAATLGISGFLLLPATLFHVLEGWNFLNSVYYAHISLSTIGFGDFVGGQTQKGAFNNLYRLFLCVWIFLGIGFISTVQLLISRVLEDRIDRFVKVIKKRCCTKPPIAKEMKSPDPDELIADSKAPASDSTASESEDEQVETTHM